MGAEVRLCSTKGLRGRTRAPRAYPGMDGRIASFAGALLVGTPRPVADGVRLTVADVAPGGRGITVSHPILPTVEAARVLAVRLRLRTGAAHALLPGSEAEAGFLVRAMLDGVPIRHVADGRAAREAVVEHAHGAPLRLAALPAAPGFEEVVACPEGGRWLRIVGLSGAQAAARAGLPKAAAVYARDLAFGGDDATDGRHYVLGMAGAGDLRAWVRVPGPEADPFELPEVSGIGDDDPFAEHAGRIADLGRAIDAMLGRRHCRRGIENGEVGHRRGPGRLA